MKYRMLRLVVMLYAFFGFASVARAGLPGGFNFSFFTDTLGTFFLAPFALAGCLLDQLSGDPSLLPF